MNNVFLYILTVLIWGTTWFAIKLQIGHAPDEVSVLYRSILASICLIGWAKVKGLSLRFKLKDHLFLFLLGLSMFSTHYLFVFNATKYLLSGIVAVVFSGVSFLSILNNFIFFKVKPSFNITLGALIGIFGLCVFFWHEVTNINLQGTTLTGLALAGIGTSVFSLSSSITKRNNVQGLNLVSCVTVGILYGTFFMFFYTLFTGKSFVLPDTGIYWLSVLYLAIPGSIIAFLCYLQLIKNIGPGLSGYTTVIAPVVALIISWFLEGYEWSIADFTGLSLVILGNILVMKKTTSKRAVSIK